MPSACRSPLPNQWCAYGEDSVAGACDEPATHTIEGDTPLDPRDPDSERVSKHLCCLHYAMVMGKSAPCVTR